MNQEQKTFLVKQALSILLYVGFSIGTIVLLLDGTVELHWKIMSAAIYLGSLIAYVFWFKFHFNQRK